ncbi:MAG: YkgJ family cysteine cluster protein [Alphaproteobacteria bacterium]|nr:YkgJ family cysteine cluster protein [Alphaproteobacteria bacterium]
MSEPDQETEAGGPLPPLQMTLRWYAGDEELPVDLLLPADPVGPQAVLPALQKLVNEVVDASVKALEATGRSVSCKAGCGACCRQIVPISDFEAHAIADVIARMPEARRAHVLQRFADAERQLAAIKPLDDIIADINGPDRYDFAVAYFGYGVACPFLEDESCSIYQDRPLICREYLVHTPVERCSTVGQGGIGVVPISRASKALFRMSTITDEAPSETRVPLSLVPYWVARHPADFKNTNGSGWMVRFVDAMMQSDSEEEAAWQRAKKKAADQASSPAGSMVAPG